MVFASPNQSNALAGVLNSIDTVVTAQEQQVFGPSMQTLPSGSAEPTPVTYPTLAPDGTPVDTLDPRNPEAGQTNQPDPNADPC
jgi:hypothetical protein